MEQRIIVLDQILIIDVEVLTFSFIVLVLHIFTSFEFLFMRYSLNTYVSYKMYTHVVLELFKMLKIFLKVTKSINL